MAGSLQNKENNRVAGQSSGFYRLGKPMAGTPVQKPCQWAALNGYVRNLYGWIAGGG